MKTTGRRQQRQAETAARPAMPWMIAGAGLLVILACYANSFRVPFLLDDLPTIVDNASIRDLRDVAAVLNPPSSSFSAGRPLLNLSFALNHAVGGLSVGGYHFVNLGLHLINAVLLGLIVARLLPRTELAARLHGRSEWVAISVAGLWALHPLQTGCVTYLSQRAESLMATCYLLTVLCFIRGVEAARARWWHALAAICCVAGMLVKEVMVTAPLACLLIDVAFFAGGVGRALATRGGSYAALSFSWLVLAGVMTGSNLSGRLNLSGGTAISGQYALLQVGALGEYAKLVVWPATLIFDRGSTREALAQFPAWRGILVAGAAAAVFLTGRGRARALGLLGGLCLLVLLPTSSVVPVWGQPIAENRLYLPLAAVVTGFVLLVFRFLPARGGIVMVGAAAALAALTVQRNQDYQTAERIWTDTVGKAPQNHRARGALGTVLLELPGRQAEGRAHLEAALQMNASDPETYYQLAVVDSGQPETMARAVERFTACLRLAPHHALAHARLGVLLAQTGRGAEAVEHLRRAVELRADRNDFRVVLGGVLAGLPGRAEEAVGQLEIAVRQDPRNAEARMNLGNALLATPHGLEPAIAAYRATLQLAPQLPAAWYNLGGALARVAGREAEAQSCFENALRLAPDFRAAADKLQKLRARGVVPGGAPPSRP